MREDGSGDMTMDVPMLQAHLGLQGAVDNRTGYSALADLDPHLSAGSAPGPLLQTAAHYHSWPVSGDCSTYRASSILKDEQRFIASTARLLLLPAFCALSRNGHPT